MIFRSPFYRVRVRVIPLGCVRSGVRTNIGPLISRSVLTTTGVRVVTTVGVSHTALHIMSNNWETGICGCFDVKDCGIGCCCKLCCVRPAPRIDLSCARKLFLPQPTFQPLTSPFISYAVPLAHGRCVCVASRRRALHASGAPPWRRPASAAALVAAWASTAAVPALFARCFGRIGEGTRPCEQMFSD